ncbi:MAG: MBL fold metallo-hydrolase [Adlercreutzia equolifaciens]
MNARLRGGPTRSARPTRRLRRARAQRAHASSDTPPDLRHQLEREGVRAVDRVLWTHAHFDHLGASASWSTWSGWSREPRFPARRACAARGHPRRVPLPDDILISKSWLLR